MEPPEGSRQPEQPDPVEADLRRAQQQIRELQSRLPTLNVRIAGGENGGTRFEARLRPFAGSVEEFRARVVAEASHRAPPIVSPAANPPTPPSSASTRPGPIDFASLAQIASSFDPIGSDEYERYAKEREEYLAAVSRIAIDNYRVAEANARTITVSLELENSGTAPAEDIDVNLHVPGGPVIRTGLFDEKELPSPPQRPRPRSQLMLDTLRPLDFGFADFHRFRDLMPKPPANVSAPSIKRTNSFDIQWHIRSVKQHTAVSLGEIALVFSSLNDARSLTLHWRVNSASLPRPTENDLHLIVART